MTQRQLAGDCLSVSYVSLLEAGRRTPKPETLRELARALGCTVAELTGERDSVAGRPPQLNLTYGRLALEDDRAEQAEDHFRAVLVAANLDPVLRVEAMIGLAQAMEYQGRLEEAARAYEGLVQQAVDGPAYVASLSVVIRWARCLYELGELARVIEIGMGAMEELDRLDAWDSEGSIQVLATVAAAHFELGDVRQAERLLREGLDRAERMRSPRARASVLWNASQIACERGRYQEALELAGEALAFFRQDSDRRSAARLLTAYGCILLYHDPPRPSEARAAFEEALDSLHTVGRGFDRAYALTELSRAMLLEGDIPGAIDSAQRSLDELGPEAVLERARAGTALAAALAAGGDQERSQSMFTEAAETLGRLKASRQASRAWAELGNMLAGAGDHVGAVAAFQKATAAVHLGPSATAAGASTR